MAISHPLIFYSPGRLRATAKPCLQQKGHTVIKDKEKDRRSRLPLLIYLLIDAEFYSYFYCLDQLLKYFVRLSTQENDILN